MTHLTVQIERATDLTVLQALLTRLGLKYTIEGAGSTDLRDDTYKLLNEEELKGALLSYAAESFKEGYSNEDEEEDEYWNSFLK